MFSSELLIFIFLAESRVLPHVLIESNIFSLKVLGCSGFSLTCWSIWWVVTVDDDEILGDGGGILIGSFGMTMELLDYIGFCKV